MLRLLSLIFMINILINLPVFGQTKYTPSIYQAYIDGDMQAWRSIIVELDKEKVKTEQQELWYEAALLKYGYIGYCIEQELEDEAEIYIESVEDDIDDMLDINPDWSEVYSLWGAVYAFRIQLSPAKAMYLGPRSMRRIDKAMELDPESPSGWLEIANSEFYRPAVFGGDKEKAITSYQKSIEYFEQDPELIFENWHYLNALIALAKAYTGTDQTDLAKKEYEKALSIAPDFVWVRDVLYPAVK